MNNYYIFIIWNKALFCKRKILEDLQKSFSVEKYFYIRWEKDRFTINQKALYGHKSTDASEKVRYTGKGKFLLILIKDNDPVFEKITTVDGSDIINAKVLEKKKLYRKWTADNFRIHASVNEKETNHDLTILLGKDYQNSIVNIENDSLIEKDTIHFEEYEKIEEFKSIIESIDRNHVYVLNDGEIVIFTGYRTDIKNIIRYKQQINKRLFIMETGEREYRVDIYGEKDGDLPEGFIDRIEDSLIDDFIEIKNQYDRFLEDRVLNNEVSSFFDKYGLAQNFSEKNAEYKLIRKSLSTKLKDEIKYCLAYIKNR